MQAQRLKPLYSDHDYFYFTFDSAVAESLRSSSRVQTVANPHRRNPVSWIRNCIASLRIAWMERPDIVICTACHTP